jgi:hypothetical protein
VLSDEYQPFIKPGKPCACGKESANATVRLFKLPIGKLARDGMPAGKWCWQCNFIRESSDVATIEAAKERPPAGSVRGLVSMARGLGFKTIRWERVDDDGETRVFVHDLLTRRNHRRATALVPAMD